MLALICMFGVFLVSAVVCKLLNGKYEKVSEVSAFITMLVALGAAIVAYGQLEASKVSSVKEIYRGYLSMAFANPELSAASYPIEAPAYYGFKKGESFEKYENYVAYLILSAEEILENDVLKSDSGWCETLRDQFRYHALYLSSDNVNIKQYSSVVDRLIRQGVEMYSLESKILHYENVSDRIIPDIEENKKNENRLKKLRSSCQT